MRAEMEDVRSVLFAVVSVATSVLWALLIELQHDANIQTLTLVSFTDTYFIKLFSCFDYYSAASLKLCRYCLYNR